MPFKKTEMHPYVGSRIDHIYKSMKQRCYGSKNMPYYKNYGGRGIKICDEWLNSEVTFIKWSYENGYADDLTIDRIDVNGDYTPENCRWVSQKVQQNNRRSNHRIEIDGVSKTATEWSDEMGISRSVILYRIAHGWSEKDAVFTPLMSFSEASHKARQKVREKGLKEDYLLDYLSHHKEGINRHEALEKFGIINLPSVIFALRAKGHSITSIKVGSYTIYRLEKGD